MRSRASRVLALTGAIGLASIGLAVASGSAAAKEIDHSSTFVTSVFATGSSSLSKPDDITSMGGSIFVSWQNGVGSKGEPASNGTPYSTIAQYSTSGRLVNSWQVLGRCDGMSADPQDGRIIATVNEDGNSSLYVIKPDTHGSAQLVHYTYSPDPMNVPGDGGGTDAPHVYRGQIFISASAPSDTSAPAVYHATLSGTTATLTPVFFDNSVATVANTNDPNHGNTTSLGLTDPDSNIVVPRSSPRFGGDFMLDSQGDGVQVYVQSAGMGGQRLFLLTLSGAGDLTSVDDTVWATSSRGTLYATDGSMTVYAIRGHFDVGAAYSAVSPCNANNAPSTGCTPPNWLGTLNLNTGLLTPVASVTIQPKGLAFVGGAGANGEASSD